MFEARIPMFMFKWILPQQDLWNCEGTDIFWK